MIDEAWPLQRLGKVPGGGIEQMSRFQSRLDEFEPATEGEKLLRGDLGFRADPYQLVYDQLMKSNP